MKIRLEERIEWGAPRQGGAFLGEAVQELGLDPEKYLAVIPGEAGRAGKVNHNTRLYDVAEAVREHERVCLLARESFQEVYLGHPDDAESWDIALRLFGGSHRIEEDGSAVLEALFAIPNTDLGRRVFFLWEEGFPIGVSLRGMGELNEVVLTEGSDYASMNPDHIGQTVGMVSNFTLGGYDVVKVPSADVYLDRPAVREALQAVTEAVSKKTEDSMSFKNLAELREKAPELAKQIEAEITEAATAELKGKVESLEAQVKEAVEAKDAAELKAAGAESGLAEQVKRIEALEAENAKAKLVREVEVALEEHLANKPAAALIREQVLRGLDGGRIASVEEAKAEADAKLEIATAAAGAPATQVSEDASRTIPAPENGGEGSQTETQENTTAAGKVANLFG